MADQIWVEVTCKVCGCKFPTVDCNYLPSTCADPARDCQRKYLHDPARYDNDILRRTDEARQKVFGNERKVKYGS